MAATAQVPNAADAFVDALERLDFSALKELFAHDIAFRALVPPGFRAAVGNAEAAALLRGWFDGATEATIVRRDSAIVGDRQCANYRVRLTGGSEPLVAEQKAICTIAGGRIASLDFLCSGFHAEQGSAAD
jgi:hypothetical protein